MNCRKEEGGAGRGGGDKDEKEKEKDPEISYQWKPACNQGTKSDPIDLGFKFVQYKVLHSRSSAFVCLFR